MGKKYFLGLVLWIFFYCFSGVAIALEATVSPPVVNFQGSALLVSSILDIDSDSRLEEALGSGLEIRFFFTVELYRVRSWWWDENVSAVSLAHTVKYDNLKKVYLINTEGEGTHITLNDYREMKKTVLLLDAAAINITKIERTSSNEKYYVRIMGEMPTFDPPIFWGIFSSSKFSTPWAESREFSFPAASSPPPESPAEDGGQGNSHSPPSTGAAPGAISGAVPGSMPGKNNADDPNKSSGVTQQKNHGTIQ